VTVHSPVQSPDYPPALPPHGRIQRSASLLRRARQLGPRGLILLARTFWLLLAARIALQCIPVQRIVAWKQRPLPAKPNSNSGAAPAPPSSTRAHTRRVREAVLLVARHSPVSFVCFPQCLAASALLRNHGIQTRLHYGVTRAPGPDEKLITHTWLEVDGEIVIGGEQADNFSTLAVY
jgi:hypothetical protein